MHEVREGVEQVRALDLNRFPVGLCAHGILLRTKEPRRARTRRSRSAPWIPGRIHHVGVRQTPGLTRKALSLERQFVRRLPRFIRACSVGALWSRELQPTFLCGVMEIAANQLLHARAAAGYEQSRFPGRSIRRRHAAHVGATWPVCGRQSRRERQVLAWLGPEAQDVTVWILDSHLVRPGVIRRRLDDDCAAG